VSARGDCALTVLCVTRDPGDRVAALLRQVREAADEILVIANAQTSAEDVGRYATVADRLLRYPFAMPGERISAWAHDQCRGDWVLTLHGDEVLSPALVAALPALVRARDVLRYFIPRRWVFPDAGHWLDEVPWSPDYQMRLVRNDPATLWFEGITHTAASPLAPALYLDEPMYHLDCIVNPAAARADKGHEYESDRPEREAPGGGPMNDVYYRPERWATRPPKAMAAADAAAVRAVLDPPRVDAAPADLAAIRLATREEIDARWDARPLPADAYRAELAAIDSDLRMAPSERRRLTFRVRNLGTEELPWGPGRGPAITVGYRLADGTEGPHSTLPCSIPPGATRIVPVDVHAPGEPGRYVLEVDLIHEQVRWFGTACRVEIEVAPRPTPGSLSAAR
jgi:hypothetical protein